MICTASWVDLAIGDALRLYAEAFSGSFQDHRFALVEGAVGGLMGVWQAIRVQARSQAGLQAKSRLSKSSSMVPP